MDTGTGYRMIVNHRDFPTGTTPEQIAAGVSAVTVTLTSDGGRALPQWHRGPEPRPEDWAIVERWTADGQVFDGWISAVTRQLIQIG